MVPIDHLELDLHFRDSDHRSSSAFVHDAIAGLEISHLRMPRKRKLVAEKVDVAPGSIDVVCLRMDVAPHQNRSVDVGRVRTLLASFELVL